MRYRGLAGAVGRPPIPQSSRPPAGNHTIARGSMNAEVVPFAGWEMCLRLANSEIEIIATAQVGPRIIRLGFVGGKNEFATYPEQCGLTGGDMWRSYGGHRLWHAPEVHPRTIVPDNHPISWWQDGDWLVLQAPTEAPTGIRKEIRVRLDADRNHLQALHKLTNFGLWTVAMAPWALSVMAPGGRLIAPQEPFQSHSSYLLPVRPLVLWGYTDMSDPRFQWGRRFIQMSQDPAATSPQKFGMRNTLGWAAYQNQDRVFLKRFPYDPCATYADLGCNAEFFTNKRMLELETLGPMVALEPGCSVTHREDWYLHRGVDLGASNDSMEAALAPLLNLDHP
jgi:hypothetical protein